MLFFKIFIILSFDFFANFSASGHLQKNRNLNVYLSYFLCYYVKCNNFFTNIYFLLIYVILGGIPMELLKNFIRKRSITAILRNYSKILQCDKRILANLAQAKNSVSNSSDIKKTIERIQQYENIHTNEIDEIIQYYKKRIELDNVKIEFWKTLKNNM